MGAIVKYNYQVLESFVAFAVLLISFLSGMSASDNPTVNQVEGSA